MRKKIIAGNWKMNLNQKSASELATGIKASLTSLKTEAEIIVFPSTIHLAMVSEILKNTAVKIGIQNIYPSALAAFTGETCPDQLKENQITHILVGHSERRQFLNETNEFCNTKIKFGIEAGFHIIYCIGELLQEREAGKTFEVLKIQLAEGLKNVSAKDAKSLTIAYEPVWAIGTGKVATPEQAEEVHAFIRKQIETLIDKETADSIRILYGGSVKADNIKELLAKPNIDGGLVGGASQKTDSFLSLF